MLPFLSHVRQCILKLVSRAPVQFCTETGVVGHKLLQPISALSHIHLLGHMWVVVPHTTTRGS